MANNETFSKALMASESVLSYLGSTKYQKSGEFAEIHDGALVTLGALASNDPYNIGDLSGILDDNVFLSAAPTQDTDPVVIVDISGVSNGIIAGNNYKIGIKLAGLKAEPGIAVRYRVPQKGDLFWVSDDCFASTPTLNQYAIPTASSTKFTPSASDESSTKFCVKILDSRDFTVGANSLGKLYLCQVISK